MYSQDFIITILVLAGAFGALYAIRRYERRPRESLKPPMLPTGPFVLLFVFVALLAIAHLLNMVGVRTGY